MLTLKELYKEIKLRLSLPGVETPELDARYLIEYHTGFDQSDLIASPDEPIPEKLRDRINRDVQARLAGKPISRILGVREFWGLDFEVTPDTLDPRPDTETLIEAALKWVQDNKLQDKPLRLVDLGTGTGCILISLLSELPNATGIAVDYSHNTASVALRNVKRHKMESCITVIQGSWMEALKDNSFDLIVSNPPYIPNLDIENLSIEVKNHDPFLSLSGGNDGFDCYKIIFSHLKNHLYDKNIAFLEMGFDQCDDMQRLVDESNLCLSRVHTDIAGIPRVVEISRGDK